jgi:hypothetical protein
MENEDVEVEAVASTAYSATVGRCAGLDIVIVPVDGTSINITDNAGGRGTGAIGARKIGARGFQLMNAIGVSPDGTPLGLLGQAWWSRPEEAPDRPARSRSVEEKETRHWLSVLESVRELFAEKRCRPWFQLDRGGDAWPVLLEALQPDIFITVRAAHDRRVGRGADGEGPSHLWDRLAHQEALGLFTIEVTGKPGRRPRTAVMEVRSMQITLDARGKRKAERPTVDLYAVFAREVQTTHEGERPLEWMLLTNRKAATFADACVVVLAYTYRWKIEEFHKTWKTGACNVEDTQLQSEHGIRLLAVVLASVAMRLLRIMWISRRKPDEPATSEFSGEEIDAVYALKKKRRPRLKVPSMATITLWIAELGGYTGKSSGGPPGVIVLTRGLAQVIPVARALRNIKERRFNNDDHDM